MLKNKWLIWPITCLIMSIATLFAELLLLNDSAYGGVIWLTIAFILCHAIFIDIYKNKNLLILIILAFNFIKYVATPLLIIITNNKTVFYHNSIKNINQAIILMIYDLVVMLLLFWLYYHSSKVVNAIKPPAMAMPLHMNMNIIFLGFIAFVFAVFIFIPQSHDMFKTFLDISEETFTHDGTYESSSNYSGITRICLTLFGVLFAVVRLLLPLYIIVKIKETNLSELTKLCISLLCILTQLLFITSTIAEALIDMMILLFLLAMLYPHKEKQLFALTGITCIFFISMYILSRYSFNVGYANNATFFEYLSNLLNSYFPGVNSIAACIDIETDNPFKLLFDTLYYCIPFNTTLFGYTGVTYGSIFNSFNHVTGQIPPSIGILYSCFGGLFVPLGSACIALAGVHCYEKAKQRTSIGQKACYMVMAFYLCSAIGVYNFQISFRYILNLVVFMAFVFIFEKKEKI